MASYTTRSGSVRVTVRMPGGERVTSTFDTRAEAEAWAEPIERQKKVGQETTGGSSKRVGDLMDIYDTMVGSKTDSGRWNSIRINMWHKDPISKLQVGRITTHDINEWAARRLKRVSGSTVSRELTLLSAVFTYGVKSLKWLKVNPCHGATRPPSAPPRDHKLLTADQILAIRIATGYQNDPVLLTKSARVGALFLLGLETGMRSGEMLRLRPEDYVRSKRYVRVTAMERGGRKGSRSGQVRNPGRDVPLTLRAVELLDQLLLNPVPGSPYIAGITDGTRDALWRKARDRSGVDDLNFHDAKHEAATRLSRFLDVFQLSHAIGTKDLKLLRDTYYSKDVERSVAQLPDSLIVHEKSPT